MGKKKEYIDKSLIHFDDWEKCKRGSIYPYAKIWIAYKDQIDRIPIADVVEVVRCKDCQFYLPQENGIGICGIHDYGTELNDFCSFGEQREGERE